MQGGKGKRLGLCLGICVLLLAGCQPKVEITSIQVERTPPSTTVPTEATSPSTQMTSMPSESPSTQPAASMQVIDGASLLALSKEAQGQDDYVIVDVRSPQEFAEGSLAKALNIDHGALINDPERLAAYKNKPVYLYCVSGRRSSMAAQALLEAGFTQVFNAPGVSQYDYKLDGD